MAEIDRAQLRRMMDENVVTIVDVLDPASYDKFHLPGAINVPLGDDFDRRVQEAVPDKAQPVALYCMDASCPASPKAAERLEALGYRRVYDYVDGKTDWKDAGLPIES